MNEDDRRGLDDDLRRLFADERLTLPVAEGAERAVVAGAHRRRRQRLAVAAAGGVLAVSAMVFATVALTGIGHGPGKVTAAAAPQSSVTLTTTSTTTPSPTPTNPDVLGPFGVGYLRLGMSANEALVIIKMMEIPSVNKSVMCQEFHAIMLQSVNAKGFLVSSTAIAPSPTTAEATMTMGSSGASSAQTVPVQIDIEISKRDGIVQLGGSGVLHTPQGIGIGSSITAVLKIYSSSLRGSMESKAALQRSALVVPVPGNPVASYVFNFGNDGLVQAMWLRSQAQLRC